MTEQEDYVDLAAFYRNWPFKRHKLVRLSGDERLSDEERALLRATVFVIDCVGPDDLGE